MRITQWRECNGLLFSTICSRRVFNEKQAAGFSKKITASLQDSVTRCGVKASVGVRLRCKENMDDGDNRPFLVFFDLLIRLDSIYEAALPGVNYFLAKNILENSNFFVLKQLNFDWDAQPEEIKAPLGQTP